MIPRIHVIDFEGHVRYGVVEYGVVTIGPSGIECTDTGICAPTAEIPLSDLRVHGIDSGKTAGARSFTACYDQWVALRRSGLFCAHNASVEHNLLKATWAYPPFVPDWSASSKVQIADWGPWLDTLQLARGLDSERSGGCSLEALAYGSEMADFIMEEARKVCPEGRCRPHAALFDAMATAIWLLQSVGFEGAIDWFLREQRPANHLQGELF